MLDIDRETASRIIHALAFAIDNKPSSAKPFSLARRCCGPLWSVGPVAPVLLLHERRMTQKSVTQ